MEVGATVVLGVDWTVINLIIWAANKTVHAWLAWL